MFKLKVGDKTATAGPCQAMLSTVSCPHVKTRGENGENFLKHQTQSKVGGMVEEKV